MTGTTTTIYIYLLLIPATIGFFVALPILIFDIYFALLIKEMSMIDASFPARLFSIYERVPYSRLMYPVSKGIALFSYEKGRYIRLRRALRPLILELIFIASLCAFTYYVHVWVSGTRIMSNLQFYVDMSLADIYLSVYAAIILYLASNPLLLWANILTVIILYSISRCTDYHTTILMRGRMAHMILYVAIVVMMQVACIIFLLNSWGRYYDMILLMLILAANIAVAIILGVSRLLKLGMLDGRYLIELRMLILSAIMFSGVSMYGGSSIVTSNSMIVRLGICLLFMISGIHEISKNRDGKGRGMAYIELFMLLIALVLVNYVWWIAVICGVFSIICLWKAGKLLGRGLETCTMSGYTVVDKSG